MFVVSRAVMAGICFFGMTLVVLGAPQTSNTALPVAEGEYVFRQQVFYKEAGNDPGPGNREVDVLGSLSVLGYGITGDLSVFGVLPLLDKKLAVTLPGGARVKRGTSGIGDGRLFARYTVFKDNAPGRTFRIAPFAGIKLPTGKSRQADSLGLLPATLQLGSGSWDPFAGLIVTYQTLDYQFDLQASYKLNTKSNGLEFGDEARLDGSLQYRIWPRDLGNFVPGFLYGVLEGNLLNQAKSKAGGVEIASSGGRQLFAAPGLQYVTRRWIAEAIVQIPVFQDLNGAALEDNYTVRAGMRFNF